MTNPSERIQEMMRKFEEQAAKAGELQSAMQDLRGSAQSPDRSVSVTVAPSGAVLDLQLSQSAMKLSHSQLQQAIMGAIRSATQNAATQLNDTVAPILGDQFDQFQQAFNVEGVAIRPGAGAPAPDADDYSAPSQQADDDFDDDGSYLR